MTGRIASNLGRGLLFGCMIAALLLHPVRAAAGSPPVASRVDGRWQLILPADAPEVTIDGRTVQAAAGRLALEPLTRGVHIVQVAATPAMTVVIRDSGTASKAPVEMPARVFEAVVEDPKLRRPAPTFRVMQGEVVQLNVSSAAPFDVHLHGYDIAAKVGPDMRLSIVFDANLAGRFSFETHGQAHGAVAFVEVLPR